MAPVAAASSWAPQKIQSCPDPIGAVPMPRTLISGPSAPNRLRSTDRDRTGRFAAGEHGPRGSEATAGGGPRPRTGARRARLGPADDDAGPGRTRPGGGSGDALGARPRALRHGRDRPPARRGRAARGRARLRLRRREPDPRHAPRLGEGAPGAARARGRLDTRGSKGARRVARGARGERLRGLPPRLPARARRRAALGRADGGGRLPVRRVPRTSTSPG